MSGPDPKAPDPSMADILASIRDILNEDEKSPPDEPLELTEAMLVPAPVEAPSAPHAAPAAPPPPAAAPAQPAAPPPVDRGATISRSGGPSLEDVVRDEMRPLLKAWLDEHLPGMVERAVKAEISRLMGGRQD